MCNCCKAGLPRFTKMNKTPHELKDGTDKRIMALEDHMDKIESGIEETVKEKFEGERKQMTKSIESTSTEKMNLTIKEQIAKAVKKVEKIVK